MGHASIRQKLASMGLVPIGLNVDSMGLATVGLKSGFQGLTFGVVFSIMVLKLGRSKIGSPDPDQDRTGPVRFQPVDRDPAGIVRSQSWIVRSGAGSSYLGPDRPIWGWIVLDRPESDDPRLGSSDPQKKKKT